MGVHICMLNFHSFSNKKILRRESLENNLTLISGFKKFIILKNVDMLLSGVKVGWL